MKTHDIDDAMASQDGWRLRILFDAIRLGLLSEQEVDRRLRRVRAMRGLPDAALAQRGIPRDRIVHHVFRDVLGP